jgi:hypothetical protein
MKAAWSKSGQVSTHRSGGWCFGWLLAFALAASSAFGQAPTGGAEVAGVVGTAVSSNSGSAFLPLKPGDRLAEGLVLKTGPRSAVDLSLGPRAGVLRLTENTTVSLDQLATGGTAPDTQVQIRFNVTEGSVVGFNNKLTTAAKYEVKTATGIAAIGGSEFRVDSRGHVVLLAGTVLVAYVPAGGEPVVHTLKAPPASYFSPLEGVRPAPKALVQEVRAQCKPKLRVR